MGSTFCAGVCVLETVPQLAPLQPAPLSVQLTPWLKGSLLTPAENCWTALAATVTVGGTVDTTIAGDVNTVMVVDACGFGSPAAVTWMVMVAGLGIRLGAV